MQDRKAVPMKEVSRPNGDSPSTGRVTILFSPGHETGMMATSESLCSSKGVQYNCGSQCTSVVDRDS